MRSAWEPTGSVPTLTGASQGGVSAGRDILRLRGQGSPVSRKVKKALLSKILKSASPSVRYPVPPRDL